MSKEKKKNRSRYLPLITDETCMELSGNRELILEGSKGVLEYSPERVRVNTSGMIVTVTGRSLDLRCISETALIIAGHITDIGFAV